MMERFVCWYLKRIRKIIATQVGCNVHGMHWDLETGKWCILRDPECESKI